MPHKHEDLKITAVKYYVNNVSYTETCRILIVLKEVLKYGLKDMKKMK